MSKVLTFICVFAFLEAFGTQAEKHVKFIGVKNEGTNHLAEIDGRHVPLQRIKRLPYEIPTEAELKEEDVPYCWIPTSIIEAGVTTDIIETIRMTFWGNFTLDGIASKEFEKILQNPTSKINLDIYDDLILSYRGDEQAAMLLAEQEKSERLRNFWKYADNLIKKEKR